MTNNYRPSPYARPQASPEASPLVAVVTLGVMFYLLWVAFALVPAMIILAPEVFATALARSGFNVDPAALVRPALVAMVIIAALFAFEFSRRLSLDNPVRRAWAIWDTARRTGLDSLGKPFLWFCLIALVAGMGMLSLFARKEVAEAAASHSLASLDAPIVPRIMGGAVALAALCVGIKSLSDYFLDGRRFLIKALSEQTPTAPEAYAKTPIGRLRFYHLVLRFAGAFSFLCECLFQVVVFGLVTWGVARAFPALALFTNAAALSPGNAIGFFADRVFSLVDGPNVFGFSFSSLQPNKAVWGFGLTLVFFKLFVISLIVRLFQTSLHLRPEDISPQWGKALSRDKSVVSD